LFIVVLHVNYAAMAPKKAGRDVQNILDERRGATDESRKRHLSGGGAVAAPSGPKLQSASAPKAAAQSSGLQTKGGLHSAARESAGSATMQRPLGYNNKVTELRKKQVRPKSAYWDMVGLAISKAQRKLNSQKEKPDKNKQTSPNKSIKRLVKKTSVLPNSKPEQPNDETHAKSSQKKQKVDHSAASSSESSSSSDSEDERIRRSEEWSHGSASRSGSNAVDPAAQESPLRRLRQSRKVDSLTFWQQVGKVVKNADIMKQSTSTSSIVPSGESAVTPSKAAGDATCSPSKDSVASASTSSSSSSTASLDSPQPGESALSAALGAAARIGSVRQHASPSSAQRTPSKRFGKKLVSPKAVIDPDCDLAAALSAAQYSTSSTASLASFAIAAEMFGAAEPLDLSPCAAEPEYAPMTTFEPAPITPAALFNPPGSRLTDSEERLVQATLSELSVLGDVLRAGERPNKREASAMTWTWSTSASMCPCRKQKLEVASGSGDASAQCNINWDVLWCTCELLWDSVPDEIIDL